MHSSALDQWPAERHLIAMGRIGAAYTLLNIFTHRTR
jgi:hypothetical protein